MSDENKTYQGSCHCGNVKFSFDHGEIKSGLRCNCSICTQKGAVMGNFVIPPDEISIDVKEKGSLGLYTFGDETANHFFCKKCGIYPFHTTFRIPGHYRVNLGCVDGVDPLALEVDIFNGKGL
jgi:hypothetical protein